MKNVTGPLFTRMCFERKRDRLQSGVMRWPFLAFGPLLACSSVSSTPTGAASATGLQGLTVASAFSINTGCVSSDCTADPGQVVVTLSPDPPGEACGTARGRPIALILTLEADPNAVAGKTFPVVASGAAAGQAEVDVSSPGDAGFIDITSGAITFSGDSARGEVKGSFSVTDARGSVAISGTFDAPACNGD